MMGECDLEVIGDPSIFNVIREPETLTNTMSDFVFNCEKNSTR